ncbi:NrfD/PsrC family molybdoenzyme membrane anchor subunit [Nonomuraea fuscirosea]
MDGAAGLRGEREATPGSAGRRRERLMVPKADFDSYYGRPVLNEPTWEAPDIGGYLFLGGLAGASSTLAAAAELTGRPRLARVSKVGALCAIGGSFYCLIHDLGRPERFLNMLRVFKVTSPMSVGTWVLTVFGPAAGCAAASEVAARLPEERPTAAQIVSALTSALGTATLSRHVRRGLTVAGSAAIALSILLWFQQARPPEQPPEQRAAVPPPTPTAVLAERSTATAITVEQAAADFRTALEARTPCGATDDDVVLDLRQVLDDTVTPRHGPSEVRTASLRAKLSTRLREGRLTPACLSELQARLDDIDAAVQRD